MDYKNPIFKEILEYELVLIWLQAYYFAYDRWYNSGSLSDQVLPWGISI